MRLIAVFALALAAAAPQRRGAPEPQETQTPLPSGKNQRQEILKADHAKSKAEAVELADLARQLKEDLEKSEHHVLDLRVVKKAEEIEKLARRIKDRLRRF